MLQKTKLQKKNRQRWWQTRYQGWLEKRIPRQHKIQLNQKNIFIFPFKGGIGFLLLLLVLFIAAANYQNNMLFGMSFFLIALFLVSIYHTFRNLSGLVFKGRHSQPVFAGETALFTIMVQRPANHPYYSIKVGWPEVSMDVVNLSENALQATAALTQVMNQRGLCHTGRLCVETTFPLGLVRAWTWLDLNLTCLVYPKPVCWESLPDGGEGEDGNNLLSNTLGTDEFYGFKSYNEGDSLRHIDWKGYARGGSLQVKEYRSFADKRHYLSWDMFPNLAVEERLSCLCYWVLQLEEQGEDYGLRLPGQEPISPSRGQAHMQLLLKQLALFTVKDDTNG